MRLDLLEQADDVKCKNGIVKLNGPYALTVSWSWDSSYWLGVPCPHDSPERPRQSYEAANLPKTFGKLGKAW